jgi:CO/xanthine dehydrogenase FAD-binding subunit
MNFRMARPAALVDLNKIPELSFIKANEHGGLSIGAMTRDSQVEDSAIVKDKFPIAIETIKHIAHRQIRNRGTFGGAIAHADPAAQLPALAVALQAKLLVKSQKADRWVEASDFFLGPFMSVLEPEEMLAEVLLPPMPPRSAGAYKQVSRQKGGYAQAAVITVLALDEDGRCTEARVVLFSVGETPILSNYASKTLVGEIPSDEAFKDVAAGIAKTEVDPGGDIHGTADYRRNLVNVLVYRCLTDAYQRLTN